MHPNTFHYGTLGKCSEKCSDSLDNRVLTKLVLSILEGLRAPLSEGLRNLVTCKEVWIQDYQLDRPISNPTWHSPLRRRDGILQCSIIKHAGGELGESRMHTILDHQPEGGRGGSSDECL